MFLLWLPTQQVAMSSTAAFSIDPFSVRFFPLLGMSEQQSSDHCPQCNCIQSRRHIGGQGSIETTPYVVLTNVVVKSIVVQASFEPVITSFLSSSHPCQHQHPVQT